LRFGPARAGPGPEQVLPSRTARHASRINSQDNCWVCPLQNSMALRAYSGGFRSSAMHPALSDFVGSVATVTVIKRSHFAHSELRKSYPVAPGSVRLRLIRFAHLGSADAQSGEATVWGEYEIAACYASLLIRRKLGAKTGKYQMSAGTERSEPPSIQYRRWRPLRAHPRIYEMCNRTFRKPRRD
jgi:hypothetical protein